MVIAISGAVIVEQSAHQMTYKRKCEACGTVQAGSEITSSPGKHVALTTQFRCPKCGNNQKVVIQGG